MALFSTYGANAVLNGTAVPATLYVKLHVGNPGADGTANPATETTRKAFTRSTSTTGTNSNDAAVTWPGIAGTEDATHFTAWDAATLGNCWLVGTVTANPYTAGDTLEIPAGDLDLTLDIWA